MPLHPFFPGPAPPNTKTSAPGPSKASLEGSLCPLCQCVVKVSSVTFQLRLHLTTHDHGSDCWGRTGNWLDITIK